TFDFANKNTVAPSGYTVSFDEELISLGNNAAVGFTFTGAEVNATYEYTFSSSGGGTPITGDGTITEPNQQINGIDLTGLPDGLVTLTVSLANPNGEGIEVTDTVALDTSLPVDYTVSIDQDIIDSSNMSSIGFTISGGEVGDDFDYTFNSSGGGVPVTGNGTISSVPHTVSGVDLSGLGDGTVTLTVIL